MIQLERGVSGMAYTHRSTIREYTWNKGGGKYDSRYHWTAVRRYTWNKGGVGLLQLE